MAPAELTLTRQLGQAAAGVGACRPAGTLHSLQTIRLQEHTAVAAVADFLYSGVGSDHLVFQQPAICPVTVETFNDQ